MRTHFGGIEELFAAFGVDVRIVCDRCEFLEAEIAAKSNRVTREGHAVNGRAATTFGLFNRLLEQR